MTRTLEGKVRHLEALMGALLGRDDRRVTDQRVVDTRVWDQVGLELVQVHVEGTVEAQARGDRADNLSNQAVEVLVVGTGNVQAAPANVVDSLVVDKERAVRVLNGAVGRKDGVVGLDDRGGDARSRVDGEFELALLAVVGREALKQEGTESGTSTTTKRVEDEESLERRAVVCFGQQAQCAGSDDSTHQQRDESSQSHCRPSPCQSCSGHEHLPLSVIVFAQLISSTHSCWRHPPCR